MENNKKISNFIQTLNLIKVQGIFDMGLIIAEGEKQKQEIVEILDKNIKKVKNYTFKQESGTNDFLEILVEALEAKKWLLINLAGGQISSQIYNQLRRLSTTNRLQVFHWREQKEFNLKQPEDSRIIFIADWPEIKALNLPEFIGLFGPVLDLTKERGIK